MSTQPRPAEGGRRRFGARRSRAELPRLVAAFALGGLAVLFAALNVDEVEVDWIITTSQTPLIVVIAVCLLVGAALGWLASRRRH